MIRLRSQAAAIVLATLAGLAQAMSIAAPGDGQPVWWLQLISLAVLAGVLSRPASVARAALIGWWFALCWLVGTFWWLYISMHVHGGLPSLLAAAAVILLASFLASYYALASGLFALLARPGSRWNTLLLACLWLGAELMRAVWFTGFPWGAGGYAHVQGPLAALAPWAGVYGLGFVASVLAFGLAEPVTALLARARQRWSPALIAALGLIGLAHVLPTGVPEPSSSPLGVALLQGNIPQEEKFEAGTGIPVALGWYRDRLASVAETLAVTPETAVPLLPMHLPPGYLAALGRKGETGDRAVLLGMPLGNYGTGYTNSAAGWVDGRQVYRYDKQHLVPFGEFIPPLFRWFTRMMNIPLGDFSRGALVQPSFAWRGELLAPNICYEDLFGEELAARFADPATAPTIFVNMSNIAWFGDTSAVDQHLAISRMRSLEFARPMLRATNTGATAIIDVRGRVTHELPRHTRGVLHGEVSGGRGVTPYARWASTAGLAPLWALALLVPALAAWGRWRRRRL